MRIKTKRPGTVAKWNDQGTLALSLTTELKKIGCKPGDEVMVVLTEDKKIVIEKP